jgi:hypothetical protein
VSIAAAAHQPALIDQRLELIQLRRSPPTTINRLSSMLDIPLHRPPITTKQPPDLGIAQPLTLQRPDIHQLLLADQHGLPAREYEPHEPQHRTRQNPNTNRHAATPAARQPSSSPLRGSSSGRRHTYIFRCPSTSIIRC